MKIYAPVKDFNGLRCNVRFVNGVAETDNANAIAWFKNHGYKVALESNVVKNVVNEQVEVVNDQIDKIENEIIVNDKELDFEGMNPHELREWMREHGYGQKIKNTRNKEKLLEILRG